MPNLVDPGPDQHRSFVAAMEEFAAEGRGAPTDHSMIGADIRSYRPQWTDPAVFAEYVSALLSVRAEEVVAARGWVPCTTLWWVDGPEFLGRIALRHRLTPVLNLDGGHIGYDVRPSARRRGHATAMLRAVLPLASSLDLASVLLTCDEDNLASQRVILKCGGVPAERLGEKLRFWIPT
jgi:predicted acetyltransferase